MPHLKKNNIILELKENSNIKEKAEELGVPFSCNSGVCGICTTNIIQGLENLNPLTEKEELMGMDQKTRLACQCKILKGTVEIE